MQTSSNIQRSNSNNLTNTIDYAFDQNLFNINTLMVCVFQQYTTHNGVKYGEVIQLIKNINTNNQPLQSPLQFNVPISYIMGGNAGINIEYKPKDLVLVGYCQRTLSDLKLAWERGNSPSSINPTTYGKFTIEDGIILGKVSPIIPAISITITDEGITINSNNTPIEINSGTADTTINAGGKVQVTASSEINLTAPSINLNGSVTCSSSLIINGRDFNRHAHIGITPGDGTSGIVAL